MKGGSNGSVRDRSALVAFCRCPTELEDDRNDGDNRMLRPGEVRVLYVAGPTGQCVLIHTAWDQVKRSKASTLLRSSRL